MSEVAVTPPPSHTLEGLGERSFWAELSLMFGLFLELKY